jgi:peroxin-19
MADDLDDLDDYLDEFQDEVFAETDAKAEEKEENLEKDNLKDTIEETLNRLKSKEDEEQSLEDLIKGMSLDGDISKALMDSMGVLMSKSVLYEPLKDITLKYPDLLAKNKDTVSTEEYERYQKQYSIVQEIVDRFESDDYDDKKDKEFISEKLDEMEATGNPPDELLGEFNNVNFGDEDLEGCEQQ